MLRPIRSGVVTIAGKDYPAEAQIPDTIKEFWTNYPQPRFWALKRGSQGDSLP